MYLAIFQYLLSCQNSTLEELSVYLSINSYMYMYSAGDLHSSTRLVGAQRRVPYHAQAPPGSQGIERPALATRSNLALLVPAGVHCFNPPHLGRCVPAIEPAIFAPLPSFPFSPPLTYTFSPFQRRLIRGGMAETSNAPVAAGAGAPTR